MDPYKPLTTMGILLIILGIILVALPIITRIIPKAEQIPWFIIWIYRSNGFYFATSPLLIALSILSIIISYLQSRG
jgi:hypothetical protein